MSKSSASPKIKFEPCLDLNASRERIGEFCEKNNVGYSISEVEKNIVAEVSDKYGNPVDYAHFVIAETLGLNVEMTLDGGKKVYVRTQRDFDSFATPSIKAALSPLVREVEESTLSGNNIPELYMILALCYYEGIGCKQDEYRAVRELDTLRTYPPAIDKLAHHYFKTGFECPKEDQARRLKRGATDLFHEASQMGYMPSRHMLGMILYENLRPRDSSETANPEKIATSVGFVREAAESGYPPAQHDYAIFLRNGIGVAQDKEKAARFFTSAGAQGYPFDNFAETQSARSETGSDDETIPAAAAGVTKKGEGSAVSRFFSCFSSSTKSSKVAPVEAADDLLEQGMRPNPSAAFVVPSKNSASGKLQSSDQGQKK